MLKRVAALYRAAARYATRIGRSMRKHVVAVVARCRYCIALKRMADVEARASARQLLYHAAAVEASSSVADISHAYKTPKMWQHVARQQNVFSRLG